jgi:hypothetical protein
VYSTHSRDVAWFLSQRVFFLITGDYSGGSRPGPAPARPGGPPAFNRATAVPLRYDAKIPRGMDAVETFPQRLPSSRPNRLYGD